MGREMDIKLAQTKKEFFKGMGKTWTQSSYQSQEYKDKIWEIKDKNKKKETSTNKTHFSPLKGQRNSEGQKMKSEVDSQGNIQNQIELQSHD